MTTLTTAPLAPLLDRLFDEAATASPATSPAFRAFSVQDRARLMRSRTDYRDFYGRLKDFPLPVSRETGRLLYMLARSCRARTIVEFGTSFGISTLHLAAASVASAFDQRESARVPSGSDCPPARRSRRLARWPSPQPSARRLTARPSADERCG